MTLKEHYGLHKRKIIIHSKMLLLLLAIAIIIIHTFARYANTVMKSTPIDLAKWILKVNGESISNSTNTLSTPIQIVSLTDGTAYVDIGDEFYFDITINPESTEVSVEYIISVDLTDVNSTFPTGTIIKKYEKYNPNNSELISTTNVNSSSVAINDTINLSSGQTALLVNNSVKYRIYCQMPQFADLVQNNALGANAQITIKQII